MKRTQLRTPKAINLFFEKVLAHFFFSGGEIESVFLWTNKKGDAAFLGTRPMYPCIWNVKLKKKDRSPA